ncbi:MAG TPA: TIM-barrel domain-containing protein [Bacteroidota bacterium]|nr:TIM-barrel domain-containing protein [Bacteroidota bacterium]
MAPLFALLLLSHSSARSQWSSSGNVDSVLVLGRSAVVLYTPTHVFRVTAPAPDVIRFEGSPGRSFESRSSPAMVHTNHANADLTVQQTSDEITISSGESKISVGKKPIRFRFLSSTGTPINDDLAEGGLSWRGNEFRVRRLKPKGERYFGLGEKAGSLERTGKSYAMWNSDIPAYKADTDPLYQTVPFYYGFRDGKAYGIYLDNPGRSYFDFGRNSPDETEMRADGGPLDLYFIAGPSPVKILSRFTSLVGRMPLPPRWSLGYQQSRWSYAPDKRVREIADTFRAKRIPCDVIYLDIDYMEGYRVFTFSKKNFPDPDGLVADLGREGFKVAVIVDPGIKADSTYAAFRSGLAADVFLHKQDGSLFLGQVWPGICAFPDFTNPRARSWWGSQFKVLVDAGVRGFWNDMNEPSVFNTASKTADPDVVHSDGVEQSPHAMNHNIYGMLMSEATYEGVRSLRPAERPFVLTRASFAGGQRFSAAWTGDNVSSWEHLRMALSMCLSVGISGQPFIGSDIGGFIGSPSGELFARWLELGVFTPLMRGHAEINSPSKEPWMFGLEFENINRKTIELRYRLLPYIYQTMREASVTGIPAMRPLLLMYPLITGDDLDDSEFLFGDDLLVAPVLQQGDTTRTLFLPEGIWYSLDGRIKYDGQRMVTVSAPIGNIPVFVKAGSVVPTQQAMQYADEAPMDPLTYTFYPDSAFTGSMYEDDGHSFEYEREGYFQRTVAARIGRGAIDVTISGPEGTYRSPARTLVAKFVDVPSMPTRVLVNERTVSMSDGSEGQTAIAGWKYSAEARTLMVRLSDPFSPIRIHAEWGEPRR